MTTNVEQEKIFFNYFLENPHYFNLIRKTFFSNEDISQLAAVAKKFYEKFHESPSREQMKVLMKKIDEDYETEIVNAIYDIKISEFDSVWLKETTEAWITWQNFDKQLVKTIEYVKTQKVTPDNVTEVVGKATRMISSDSIISFDNNFGLDFFRPEDHRQDVVKQIPSGYNFINEKLGGYDQKTMVCYIGAPNVGKSIFLCNEAANFVKNGYNVLFVSCEMSEQKVLRRIGSNLLNIGMDEYINKSRDVELIKKKLKKVGNGLMPHGKLWIKEYPTSTATPFDIETYIKTFSETHDYKIDVVVVDYLGIMASNRNNSTDNMYLKNKVIAEDLRALAVKYDLLVVTAMQINRGSGWDNTDMKMEDIAESAGIPATADTMLGIIQDAVMYTNEEYWLKLLKVRDGEGKNRKCKLKIDYNYMRLIETDEIID